MEHSKNYNALLILRKALEIMIDLDPCLGYYGCSAIYHAADKLKLEGDESQTIAYGANNKAYYGEYIDQAHAVYWRNNYDQNDSAGLSTAELRQYRIANFYRAIDLQEKVVAAEVLEEVLAEYKSKEEGRRYDEFLAGFCGYLCDVLLYPPGPRRLEHYGIAKKYWVTVEKHRTRTSSMFWFNTVQERIDAVTKLINELKGNTP